MTNHDRHYSAWRVEIRPAKFGFLTTELQHRVRFKAIAPTDPCNDYQDVRMFDTFDEAMNFAQREALRAKILEDFENYLNANQNKTCSEALDHTGLDTMIKYMRIYGNRWDLAEFMENL